MGLLLVLQLLNYRGSKGLLNLVHSGFANEESFFKHNIWDVGFKQCRCDELCQRILRIEGDNGSCQTLGSAECKMQQTSREHKHVSFREICGKQRVSTVYESCLK